jgi:hypothetical protein
MSTALTDFASKLGTLAEDPTNYWDDYELASKPQVPLEPGMYVVQVPMLGDTFKPGGTKADKDGKQHFQLEMDPVVTYPVADAGRVLKFVRLSVKKSEYRSGSLAGDLVMVTGIGAQPRSNQEWLSTLPMLQGQEFGVEVDLRVWDKDLGKEIYGKKGGPFPMVDGKTKTRFVYNKGVLLMDPEKEAEALKVRDAGGPAAAAIKVLYANNNIVRIMKADDVKALRKAA